VKIQKPTDYRGFARIKTNDLSVPIRVHPWLGFNFFTASLALGHIMAALTGLVALVS